MEYIHNVITRDAQQVTDLVGTGSHPDAALLILKVYCPSLAPVAKPPNFGPPTCTAELWLLFDRPSPLGPMRVPPELGSHRKFL